MLKSATETERLMPSAARRLRPRLGASPPHPAARRRFRPCPLLIYLGVFYAYPVASMMFPQHSRAAMDARQFSARSSRAAPIFSSSGSPSGSGLVVTAISLVLGFSRRLRPSPASIAPKSNLLMILVLVPFWTSILVRTYAWMVLLGRQGIINQLLLWLGVIDEPIRLLNTTFARLCRDGGTCCCRS